MHRLVLLSILLPGLFLKSYGQYLGAFQDFRGNLQAFDNGFIRQLEYLPTKSFKIGGNTIAYVDNIGNFKVDFKKETTLLAVTKPDEYTVTDNLVTYKIAGSLQVFDRGKPTTLAGYSRQSSTNDSIVAFLDENTYSFNVYYNNKITTLESSLLKKSDYNFKTGDNILAYVSSANVFNAFYQEQIVKLDDNEPLSFEASKNIIGYVDSYNNFFKTFFRGKIMTLEKFAPTSYKPGNNLIAYVDNIGAFKIFYEERGGTLLSYAPAFYEVEDDIVVYGDNTVFKVFYKGKAYTLENFIPTEYKFDNGMLAYTDAAGFLKVFDKGVTKQISQAVVSQFDINRNVIQFVTLHNTINFYYDGKFATN